jgi:ketosteroid isomerase-like protein
MQSSDSATMARQLVDEAIKALNNHDSTTLLTLVSNDIVFENTSPAPDGTRYSGKREVEEFISQFFSNSPGATFEVEALFEGDDHVTVMHRYTWSSTPEPGDPGYVRGVTVYRIRDNKIVEMYPYVKG